MKIIFGALIVLCVALTACGSVHSLEYTYNATSGGYIVTAGTADAYHNTAVDEYHNTAITECYRADPALKIDEENRDYIASDGKAYPLGLMFRPYYEYNVTQDPYAKLLSNHEYNPYTINESELKEIVTLCDDAIQHGNDLINYTIAKEEDTYIPGTILIGPMAYYYEFMKINEITDLLLNLRYSAICALATRNVSGYNQKAVDEAKSIMENFKYDDSDAFSFYENLRIAWHNFFIERENQKAHSIKLEQGNYESTKFTVPLDNYTATFELRMFPEMSGRFWTDIKNTTISQEVGSGKEYHIESFNVTKFGIEDAYSGTDYLDISIAQYTGPTRYKPTQPFNGYTAVKGDSKRLETYGAGDIQIDDHTGWLENTYYKFQDKWPDRHAVTYALDANTFVMIDTDRLDYDRDVALLFETFHIEKKVK